MESLLAGIPFLNKRIKFPVTPHFPGGFLTPKELSQVAAVAAKYGGTIKIAGGNVIIMDLNVADGKAALAELGVRPESFIAKSVRAVTMCAGKPNCPMAKQDSTAVGMALDHEFFGRSMPGKLRIGVSGCPNCCAEVHVKDIGLFGTPQGFTLILGGNAGRRAKVGRVVAEAVPSEQVRDIVSAVLQFYEQKGKEKERLGDTFDRVGWEESIAATIPDQYRTKSHNQ